MLRTAKAMLLLVINSFASILLYDVLAVLKF